MLLWMGGHCLASWQVYDSMQTELSRERTWIGWAARPCRDILGNLMEGLGK